MVSQTFSQISSLWQRILKSIDVQLGSPQIYDAFFKETYIHGIDGSNIIIVCDSVLAKTLLSSQYYDLIQSVVDKETGTDFELLFKTKDDVKNATGRDFEKSSKPSFFENIILNPHYNFENFVVGPSNKEANQASLIVASNPGELYNPLFIYGGSGLGKTHLLNSIGNFIKEKQPLKKILCITAQDFLDQYLEYVNSSQKNDNLSSYIKSFDVLLLDDIQMLKDKTKTLEFLFDIYQSFLQSKKQVVLTSDRMPSELNGINERLVTRFMEGLTVQITKPDAFMCEEILKNKIKDSGMDVNLFDPEVISFVAERFKSSIRELNGALNRIMFIKDTFHAQRIDMALASQALSNITDISGAKTKVNENKILNVVSNYYNLSVNQITGKLKTAQIVTARHIAIYLLRTLLDMPFKSIGVIFSDRDHSSIMYAVQKVEKMLRKDQQLKLAIDELKKRING